MTPPFFSNAGTDALEYLADGTLAAESISGGVLDGFSVRGSFSGPQRTSLSVRK